MSRSPKYSEPIIEPAVLEALAVALRQRAEEQAERRRQREAEVYRQQLRTAKTGLIDLLQGQVDDMRNHQRTAYAPFAIGWQGLEQDADQLLRRARQSNSLDEVHEIRAEAESLCRRLSRHVTEARKRQLAEQLRLEQELEQAEVRLALTRLKGDLAGLNLALSEKFDTRGLVRIRSEAGQASALLQTGQARAALEVLGDAQEHLDKHRATVETRHATWLAERRDAEQAILALARDAAGLQADDTAKRWLGPALEALEIETAELQGLFDGDKFATVIGRVRGARASLVDAIAGAQQAQLQEDKRAYIVSGLVEVLASDGFHVGQPALTVSEDYTSAVVIRAERPDGRQLDVTIPHSGRVEYSIDGYPQRTALGTDGAPHPTCDEAEAHLLAIHETLLQHFQVRMGELWWQDKDPSRIRREAKALPRDDAGQRRTR